MVRVRPATPADHPALAALFTEMQAHYAVPCPERDVLLAGLSARPAGTGLLVAEVAARITGFAAYAAVYPGPGLVPGLFLKEIYVAAVARGSGAGRALLRELARLAVERGFGRVDWTADRGDTRLLAFYESLGAAPQPEKLFFRLSGEALRRLADGPDAPAAEP